MLASIEDTRSSDNVRQVECWFPHFTGLFSSFQQFPCVDPLALHAAEPSIDVLNLPTVFYGCLLFIRADCRGFLGGFCANGISMCLFGLLFRLLMRRC